MNGKKIVWITSDCFIDTDLPIIKSFDLAQFQYDLSWNIFFTKNRIDKFNTNYIESELKESDFSANYHFLNKRSRSVQTLLSLIRILFEIKKKNPDLIYIDASIEPFLPFLARIILGSQKTIIAIHDVRPHVGVSKIFHYILIIQIKMFRNFHLFSKNQTKIFKTKYSKWGKKTFCIPMLLKHLSESKLTPVSNKVTFLFFGTIRENKGIDIFVNAINRLTNTHKNKFQVILAGNCDNWDIIKIKIIDISVYKPIIKLIPNEQVADLFCQSNYLVLPYLDVTQSGPLMIAYNYEIPCIASNLPGFSENIINGVNGFLFETGNSESLYETLCKTIDNHSKNYNSIKNNLRIFIDQHYKIEEIKTKYIKMFDEIAFG